MKGFDCRDESLWIPKHNYVSGYKARSIHLRWLDFSGEGATGGWKHAATADASAISRFQSDHVSPFTDQFFFGSPEKKMKFVNVSSKVDHPWKVLHIPLQRAAAEACWGFFGVSALIWNVIFHICVFRAAARFPATVTKGIVLFHGAATSTLPALTVHP